MKFVVLTVLGGAAAFFIARKTGLISRDQVDAITEAVAEQASSVTDAAKSTAESAVTTVSDKVSDVLPNHK